MNTVVKARVVKIGNSRGVRIPKSFLEQIGIAEDAELELEGDRIILRAARSPRDGWAAAFAAMSVSGDDQLLDSDGVSGTTWDAEEWTW
jgi:antitoxin MazE